MHCDQCGKENRLGSKFCRSCGDSLSEGSHGSNGGKDKTLNIPWKSPIILIIVGLAILGGLFYGGSRAYAYYQVQSKISSAKKLQSAGDFNGSLSVLNNLGGYSPTAGQQNSIDTIKTDDQKFLAFKTSFNAGVALENSSSAAKLQTALKDLQSIDTSYPAYTDVQTEIAKVQNLLVTTFQNDANTSKKATTEAQAQAEKNRQAAISAQAIADSAVANAAQVAATAATNAKTAEVEKSFYNQLYTDFKNLSNGTTYFNTGMADLNSGQGSTALISFAKANAVYNSINEDALNMNKTFTNMPQSYTDAANNLAQAAYYYVQATNSAIDATSYSSDTSATTNYNSNTGNSYKNNVYSFLTSNAN